MAKHTFHVKLLRILLLSVALLAVLSLSYFRVFDNYEMELLDTRFVLRGPQSTNPDIILIEIGDDTLEKLGEWPIGREYHALLIKALSEAGAKTIIFDMFFSEPREHDEDLEKAIRDSGRVYIPFVFNIPRQARVDVIQARGYTAKLLMRFEAYTKGSGHINILPDADGKYRRVPLYIRYKDRYYPYLSFLATCDILGISQDGVELMPGSSLILGDKVRIPLDENSNMLINFSGRWVSSFKHYSYVDILQSYFSALTGQEQILDLGLFRDKICIIGLTAAGTTDIHPNPFEPLYPGVGVHAEVANSILGEKFISRASREMNLLMLIILGLFMTAVTMKTRPSRGLLVLLFLLFVLLASSAILFNLLGLWIDLFCPIVVIAILYLSLTFYKYIVERQKRQFLERELDIAKTIQESFLPKSLPDLEGVELSARMFTAYQVGGDMYDFMNFDDGRLGVIVGDVTGKGIPAALFMAMAISDFKILAREEESPSKLMSRLNEKLVSDASSKLFVTAFYIVLDVNKKEIAFSSGGHLPGILVREKDDSVQLLDVEEGMPLGLMEGNFDEKTIKLESGDTIVLYTDGVTEAMDTKGRMYEQDRLCNLVKANRYRKPDELLKIIKEDVRRFEGKAGQHDDVTIAILHIK